MTMATAGFTNGGVWWPPHVYGEIERLGFDAIWSSEHLLLWRPILDAIPLMAGISACTSTIEIGSSVLLFPPRHPLVLAKALATIDRMCGGRLVVGAGGGGDYRVELEATGTAKNYGRRFDEMIDVMRKFWTEEYVDHDGEYFQIERAGLFEPKPVRDGHIPLLIGGRSDAAIDRAVLRGNGYQPYMVHARRVRDSYRRIEERAEELGVELAADFRWSCSIYVAVDSDEKRARESALRDLSWRYNQDATAIVDKFVLFGSPEKVRQGLEEYLEAGVQDFSFGLTHPHSLVENAMPNEVETEAAVDHFTMFAGEILPMLQR